jgi:hypothetical protein
LLEDKTSAREIKSILKDLEKQNQGRSAEDTKLNTLAQVYKHAIERIDRQKSGFRLLAKKVLSWITCAKRLLTTSELQHALAVNIGDRNLDKENLREVDNMVSVYAGLVTVDEETRIICLIYYTTQEYFERTQEKWFPNAETDIAAICVTYLSFDAFETGFCPTDEEFEARLQLNVLYDYASRNWGHHVRAASTEEELLILRFLNSEAKLSASSQAMMASKLFSSDHGFNQRVPRQMTGEHLAAYFGLKEAMTALLKNRHDLDSKDSDGQTPLSWAAGNGHEAIVKLLLEKGANPNSKGIGQNYFDNIHGGTSLLYAAKSGNEAVVKLLHEKGAVLDSMDGSGRTPLSYAAGKGHEAVVKLLLEKGAKLDSMEDFYTGAAPLWLWIKYHSPDFWLQFT